MVTQQLKYDLNIWNQIKQHQIDLLTEMPEISALQSQYVDDFAPYRVYYDLRHPKREDYSLKGYEFITFTFDCPAVVDCRGRSGPNGPHKIKMTDVKIQMSHKMEVYFPRNFNADPIGWGIRFSSMTPMYPNIFCAEMNPGGSQWIMKFSGGAHSMSNLMDGLVCIGAAASRTRPVDAAYLMRDLIRSLKILDDNRFAALGSGGVNDQGFDALLFEHYVLNLATIKSAIRNYENKPKKKKLGKTPSKKKKLGRRADEL
jgi:hypothetical protein